MQLAPKSHKLPISIFFALIGCVLVIYIESKFPLQLGNIQFLYYLAFIMLANLIGGFTAGMLSAIILGGQLLYVLTGKMPNSLSLLTVLLFFSESIVVSYFLKKLYDTEEIVSGVFKSIVDPFVIFDETWRCVYANKYAEELFGKKKGELMGKNIREVLPDTTRNPMYKKVLDAASNNKHIHHVYYSNSAERWIDANLYPSSRGLAVLFMDITHQKSLEKKLEESELAFKKLIDSNIIGVAIEDIKGKVHYANDVYLGLTGYTRADLQKNLVHWEKITPPEYRKKDEAIRRNLLKKGSIKPYEKEYVQKNGGRISVLKGATLLDKRKKTSAVFALDISQRVEREKRKDEFLSIASHELKTPITSIKGFAQLLMRHAQGKDEKTLSYLKRMVNQINRLTYLVNDILDVRKIENNKLVLVKDFIDANQLVEDAVKAVHTSSPSHVITWQPAKNAMLFGDYNRLYQALLNVLANAVKYSPATEEIKVAVKEEADQIIISVADRGIGIPEEKQKHIFNKFFQVETNTRSSYPGLGIGLFIASEIIKKHGGRIWVKSPTVNNHGSTFYFSIPKNKIKS